MRVRISLGARTSIHGGALGKARQDGNVAAVFQESRYAWKFTYAFLAQLVEHFSRKEEVTGSNPVAGSKVYKNETPLKKTWFVSFFQTIE